MHYNWNSGGAANSWPFNASGGKAAEYLFKAGAFGVPTPVPPGQEITKIYILMGHTGTRTFTDLHLLMGQTTATSFTRGSFYTGQYDTVYHQTSVTLSSTANSFMSITLDTPFPYDPTKSLVLFIGQCGYTGSGIMSILNMTTPPDTTRNWSVGGCPFVCYSYGQPNTAGFGVDVQPAVTTCNYIAGAWCPAGTLPNLPGPSIYGASEYLGDTLYMHAPTSSSASTTIRRYTLGGTWTLGTPLPAAKVYGALVACNSKLYFIGGGTGSAGGNATYEYDPGTGAWTTKANMPAALGGHNAVCWEDSVIFVYGGPWNTNGTHRNVYYYRVGSNTWGTITNSLPTAAGRRSAGAGIYGNKMVLCAGYKYAAPNFLKTTLIGTIGSNATQVTWTTAPDVPVPYSGLSRMGGTSWDKYFFTVGGERGGPGGYHNVSYVLDITTATWIDSIKPMPIGYSNIWNQVAAGCVDDTTRIFVPGGYSGIYNPAFFITGCGPILVGSKTIAEIPIKYDLSQNYPNPFNPSTKINFTIPKTGLVTLKVYDILGKEIATLVNEVKNTGSYIVEFNGSNLSSGTYFYRMQAGDFVSIKKMMFIK